MRIAIATERSPTQQVLGAIVAEGLREAGYDVHLRPVRDGARAIARRRVDAYLPSIADVLITSGAAWDDVPRDRGQAYELARRELRDDGLAALAPAPFTTARVVVTTRGLAEELGLELVSDIKAKQDEVILFVPPGCRPHPDCFEGLAEKYGLYPRNVVETWAFRDIVEGPANVAVHHATDPLIRRRGYVMLEDDKHIQRPQNPMLVIRNGKAAKAGPTLGRTVRKATWGLTTAMMRELNARVRLDGENPRRVARRHLRRIGVIPPVRE